MSYKRLERYIKLGKGKKKVKEIVIAALENLNDINLYKMAMHILWTVKASETRQLKPEVCICIYSKDLFTVIYS